MSDDWLDDLGPDTPPEVIDSAIAGMTPLPAGAGAETLHLWAALHVLRAVQAAMQPGRWSGPGDLGQAVDAGEKALRRLREDGEEDPQTEVAVLLIVAEALTLRDAGGDLDRAVQVLADATRRFRRGSAEWMQAVNDLSHRHVARYAKQHRDEDFGAAEEALVTLLEAGWPDRASLWQRYGSLHEERFRHGGVAGDHRRALEILRTGWDEESRFPLLALSIADAVVNSDAEPAPEDLEAAAGALAAVDLDDLPAPMRPQLHHLVMMVQFRRAETEACVRAAERLIEDAGTEPRLRAEARWIRAGARLQHASRTNERMADVDPIIADLEAAAPLLNAVQRRLADVQLTRMLAERARRTGNHGDADAAEAFATRALDHQIAGTAGAAEIVYHLAFLLLSRAEAGRAAPAVARRAIGMLRQVADDPATAAKVRVAATVQFAGATCAGHHYLGGAPAALDEAVTLTRGALERTSLDDMNRVALAAALANVLLLRFETRGDLADLRWSLGLLQDARDEAPGDPNRQELLLALAQAQSMWAEATATALPGETAGILRDALALAAPGDPRRVRTLRALAAAHAVRAQHGHDIEDWARAAAYAREMAAGLPAGAPSTAMMRMSAGGTLLLAGRGLDDLAMLRQGVDLVGAALRDPAGDLLRGRHLAGYGTALLALHQRAPQPGDLDRAIVALREAWDLAAARPGQRGAAEIGMGLAVALAADGDPVAAAEAGRAALRERAWQVLLQTGTHDAMTSARRSATDAVHVARAALRAGDPAGAWLALESGRGLVLHAATVASTVPDLLRAAGSDELAEQWGAGPSAGGGAGWRTGTPVLPGDARFRALRVLARETGLFEPPSVTQVGAALRDVGADALVYLFPGTPGFALLVEPDGRITPLDLPRLTGDWAIPAAVQAAVTGREPADDAAVAAPGPGPDGGGPAGVPRDLGAAPDASVVGATLAEVCRAAWHAAIRPLLDHWGRTRTGGTPHLVLVPDGALATVPWHAAHGEGRWAIDEAAFSYIASGRLLVEVARRTPPPLAGAGLVIGNPDTGRADEDLPGAGAEASSIFQKHYAAGRYLGRPGDLATGPGRPGDVLGWLAADGTPPATVLHLACHGVIRADGPASSYLVLAGGSRVSAEELLRAASGRVPGLVSLAACTTHRAGRAYDEAVTLSTGFLVAGATTAIGSLWPVPDRETARLMVAFHDNLAGAGLPPHVALREAQLSVRDPADESTLAHWAGFVHLGR